MDKQFEIYNLPANALLTAKQAAEFLRIRVGSLYNMVNKGRVLPRRLGDGKKARLRFVKSDLEKLLG